jgi:aspartyl-tRNA(Asn)/glutamyl-tRNA(Gln) amidotransferase subunit B
MMQIIPILLDKNGGSPREIIMEFSLGKAESDAMQRAVREAAAENAAVADYQAGSERALNFIVGAVMKKTRGKADAGEVHRLVKAEVEKAQSHFFEKRLRPIPAGRIAKHARNQKPACS